MKIEWRELVAAAIRREEVEIETRGLRGCINKSLEQDARLETAWTNPMRFSFRSFSVSCGAPAR
jgi:hypothetical protein